MLASALNDTGRRDAITAVTTPATNVARQMIRFLSSNTVSNSTRETSIGAFDGADSVIIGSEVFSGISFESILL